MNPKYLILWLLIFGLLLFSACNAKPTATPSAASVTSPSPEVAFTHTEVITLTPEVTEPSGPSFVNPVYARDFPDPHVILAEDTYYAYSTNSGGTNIPVLRSTDLIQWESLGDALPALPKWSTLNFGNVWAPGVIQVNETFLLYYVARDKEADRQCIGVAVSDSPQGPFKDSNDKAFICQADLGGSIDPYPFRDDDGKLYLFWKNDGNCCGREVALWAQELSPDGLALQGEPVKLIVQDQPWERPLIENPAMVKQNDNYYLFYSGNWWESHQYAVGYAICETVTGPCEKPLNEPWFQFKAPVMGPGGEAFFTDIRGNLWMAYHAWTGANVGYGGGGQRSLHIDLVTFDADKPMTNGPSSTPQLLP